MTLNWRHKAGLFLALTATGLALLLDCSAKQAAGIALLFIALAWLVGSLTLRTLGTASLILISLIGSYVAAAPVWQDWSSFRESANEYDWAITELRSRVKKAKPDIDISDGAVGMEKSKGNGFSLFIPRQASKPLRDEDIDFSQYEKPAAKVRSFWLPESAEKWVREDQHAFQKWFAQHPLGATDQIWVIFPENASDTEIMHKFEMEILRPRPTFSLASALGSHVWSLLLGVGLLASGLLGCARMLLQLRTTN